MGSGSSGSPCATCAVGHSERENVLEFIDFILHIIGVAVCFGFFAIVFGGMIFLGIVEWNYIKNGMQNESD